MLLYYNNCTVLNLRNIKSLRSRLKKYVFEIIIIYDNKVQVLNVSQKAASLKKQINKRYFCKI